MDTPPIACTCAWTWTPGRLCTTSRQLYLTRYCMPTIWPRLPPTPTSTPYLTLPPTPTPTPSLTVLTALLPSLEPTSSPNPNQTPLSSPLPTPPPTPMPTFPPLPPLSPSPTPTLTNTVLFWTLRLKHYSIYGYKVQWNTEEKYNKAFNLILTSRSWWVKIGV